MSHCYRVSASTKTEVIEEALGNLNEMKDHLESCRSCSDDGFCPTATPIQGRVEESRRQLRRIGAE